MQVVNILSLCRMEYILRLVHRNLSLSLLSTYTEDIESFLKKEKLIFTYRKINIEFHIPY